MDRPTRPSPTATSPGPRAPAPASRPDTPKVIKPADAPLTPWRDPLVDELVAQARRRRADPGAPFVLPSEDVVIDLRDRPTWSDAVRHATKNGGGATPDPSATPAPASASARAAPSTLSAHPVMVVPHRSSRSRVALEWMVVVAGAALVALALQLTTFQVFTIPSESMSPTLEVGDKIVVNKWAYRFGDVHRGDIVVFSKPDGADVEGPDIVKRVVGVANDELTIVDGHVRVNGKAIDEPYLPPGTVTPATGTYPCLPSAPCIIPPGQIFVMGDNRSNSADSRIFGPIPTSSVLGQAELRIWPTDRAERL